MQPPRQPLPHALRVPRCTASGASAWNVRSLRDRYWGREIESALYLSFFAPLIKRRVSRSSPACGAAM
eukprot:168691-Prymnesium_polylepis.1